MMRIIQQDTGGGRKGSTAKHEERIISLHASDDYRSKIIVLHKDEKEVLKLKAKLERSKEC